MTKSLYNINTIKESSKMYDSDDPHDDVSFNQETFWDWIRRRDREENEKQACDNAATD
jgi:hypothetical protein